MSQLDKPNIRTEAEIRAAMDMRERAARVCEQAGQAMWAKMIRLLPLHETTMGKQEEKP